MNEVQWTTEFPLPWNEWREQWRAWMDLRRPTSVGRIMPGKNLLAEEILGTFETPNGKAELSEVTFPVFGRAERERTGKERARYIGVTFGVGRAEDGGVVATFAELDRMLGFVMTCHLCEGERHHRFIRKMVVDNELVPTCLECAEAEIRAQVIESTRIPLDDYEMEQP